MKLPEILTKLETALAAMSEMRGNLDDPGISDLTALMLGEALGVTMRAKTLVERDIERSMVGNP